jgi:hypothetical protein
VKEIPENRIEVLVRQKREGRSYNDIRTRLKEEGLTEEEISRTIRQVDEKVLQAEMAEGSIARGRRWYYTGVAIAAAGLVLTFLHSRGYMLTGMPRGVVYLPFFAGILIMFIGRRMQRIGAEPLKKGQGRIQRKRPFKG